MLCAEERAAAMTATATALNQIHAYLTDLAGAADAQGDSRVLRAGTTSTLVATTTGSTPAVGAGIVHTAQQLRDLPEVADAYRKGQISGMHVRAILDHSPHISEFAARQDAVVALAGATDPREVGRILQVIADNDTDNPHPTLSYAAQRDRRSARLSSGPNGMWRLTALLDETTGAVLADALAAATAGTDDTGDTLPQRRADALTDLIDAGHTTTRPLGVSAVSILIDVEHLPDGTGARLPDGTPILPNDFDYYSCAAVCSIIFGVHRDDTFLPLALGRTKRRATAAQWAALIARDHGCIRCGRPPRYCQAHHIHHWKHGGPTDLANL